MKRHSKPARRRKADAVGHFTKRDWDEIEAACDRPVEIAPPGWSFVDWAGLVFILAMVALAMWEAFT